MKFSNSRIFRGGERIYRELQRAIGRRVFERGMVCFAGGCTAEADEVPRPLQSRTAAQRFGGSNAGGFRGATQAGGRKN